MSFAPCYAYAYVLGGTKSSTYLNSTPSATQASPLARCSPTHPAGQPAAISNLGGQCSLSMCMDLLCVCMYIPC